MKSQFKLLLYLLWDICLLIMWHVCCAISLMWKLLLYLLCGEIIIIFIVEYLFGIYVEMILYIL